MKKIFKKITVLTCLTVLLVGFFIPVYFSFADIVCQEGVPSDDGLSCVAAPTTSDSEYKFLSPLPEIGETFDPSSVGGEGGSDALGKYLNAMIKLFIGICAVLAVIMIVLGGIEYMTSELPGNKESGKERITHAIFGLLLALGAWLILYTINPNLLSTKLESLKVVEVEVELAEDNILATDSNPPCIEADMTSITLFGKSGVKVNKKVVNTLRNIEAAWVAKGGSKFYQLFLLAGWGWGGRWTSIKDAMHFSSNNK